MVRLLSSSIPLLLLCVLVFASANLIQFGKIIQHLTGRPPLIYNGYGCYCGLGGSKQPMDATDWCCRAHDCCYQALKQHRCKPKLERYSYTIAKNSVTCSGKTDCQKRTCECDTAAALCFRNSAFHPGLIGYPNVLCRGRTPPCQELCQSCAAPLPVSSCQRGQGSRHAVSTKTTPFP